MSDGYADDLWRDFPKTAIEFEKHFATEEDCQRYWIKARWADTPVCARCKSAHVWPVREGRWFECADCRHQTSLTSGTPLEKTRKPLKMWFRAVFEISSRRNGISAKELQRILGLGSYETAWTWLHKLRGALVRPHREPLAKHVEVDEAFVGDKEGKAAGARRHRNRRPRAHEPRGEQRRRNREALRRRRDRTRRQRHDRRP